MKGKTEENYHHPVERDIENLKKEILKKVDVKDMMAGKGKKMKILRKTLENQLLETFKEAHFGILPLTKPKLEYLCKNKGLNPNLYDLNPNTGLIRNTCMS